jgi:hypothetical protein
VRRCGLVSSSSGYGPVAVYCEHVDEPSGSVEGGEFLDWLKDYRVLKKVSAPWS